MHDISDATKKLGKTWLNRPGQAEGEGKQEPVGKGIYPFGCLKDKRSARIVARVRQLIWQSGLSVEEGLKRPLS